MRFLAMLGFLVCVVVSSCSTVAPIVVKTFEELLAGTTAKTWVLTNLIDTDGRDVTALYSSLKYQFRRDGSLTATLVFVSQPNAPQTVNGTWKLVDKKLTVTIQSGSPGGQSSASDDVIVDELTETVLKISAAASTSKGKYTFKAE